MFSYRMYELTAVLVVIKCHSHLQLLKGLPLAFPQNLGSDLYILIDHLFSNVNDQQVNQDSLPMAKTIGLNIKYIFLNVVQQSKCYWKPLSSGISLSVCIGYSRRAKDTILNR